MTGKNPKIKLAAGIILVFLVGALAGVLGASIYFEARFEKIFHGGPPRGEDIIERLKKELDLTPAQVKEIRPIVMSIDKKSFELRKQFMPRVVRLHEQARAQIREKLNEAQKIKFDEINERLKKRFREKPPFPPPPPPMDGPPKGPPKKAPLKQKD